MWWMLALGAQAAEPLTLDYVSWPGCPNQDRFADEVSARLGRVAFGSSGTEVSVQLIEANPGFLGVLTIGEGKRMARGSSCDEAFDKLVVAAAVLLDAPQPEFVVDLPSADTARVTVTSKQKGMKVVEITGRGRGSFGTTTVLATYYRNICKTPCSFEIDPGLVEIGAMGKFTRLGSKEYELTAGTHTNLVVKPRSNALIIGGVAASTLGSALAMFSMSRAIQSCNPLIIDSVADCERRRRAAMPGLVGGTVMVAGSIPLYFLRNRVVRSEVTR
ncbi:MAG: hypothetical protein KTR31_37920 [Myxococcales bacterium]|nr:hypothetical protein [Myxococcales bacterium]